MKSTQSELITIYQIKNLKIPLKEESVTSAIFTAKSMKTPFSGNEIAEEKNAHVKEKLKDWIHRPKILSNSIHSTAKGS